MTTEQIVLAARPKGWPDTNTFRFENVTLPALEEGEVLVKGLVYSVDPYMRGRMNEGKSYIPQFEVNAPISGGVVGEVAESNYEGLQPGDKVVGMLPWSRLSVVPGKQLQKVDTTLAPAGYYLGVLGMPGVTAYVGLLDIAQAKAGETVVVSGAAGAVGLVVGQLAKIKGCRVVGIAGSADKVELLKNTYGFDEVINYKTTADMEGAIAAACPDGVDVYFDNVGGEISDAVFTQLNFYARVTVCGQIALYNDTKPAPGPRVLLDVVKKSLSIRGFTIGNYRDRFPAVIAELAGWLKAGQLQYSETKVKGFEKLPETFLGLFKGQNTGKLVVEV